MELKPGDMLRSVGGAVLLYLSDDEMLWVCYTGPEKVGTIDCTWLSVENFKYNARFAKTSNILDLAYDVSVALGKEE